MIVAWEDLGKVLNVGDNQWYRIKTLGDGSCLIHAILYGFCSRYRKRDRAAKTSLVKDIRRSLSLHLTEDVYTKLGHIQHRDLSEFSRDRMVATLNSSQELGYGYLPYLAHQFQTNIIVLYKNSSKSIEPYPREDSPFVYDRTVVIYYDKKRNHFETIGYQGKLPDSTEQYLITVFDPHDSLIKPWTTPAKESRTKQ